MRRPVVVAFFVALVVRGLAAIVITFARGFLFADEAQYVGLGRLAAAGRLTPTYMINGQTGDSLFHEAAAFMWPLTVLFRVFGPHVLVAALWAALFGALAAALVALLVGRVLPPLWSGVAGLVVALFPSQVLWSSLVFRESMVWAALAAAALGIAQMAHTERWRPLAGGAVLLGGSLLTLAYLRDWVFVPAAWASAVAVWLFRPARPVVVRATCSVLCLLLPLAVGLGLAGATYVHRNTNLSYERDVLSLGAKSAFVHPEVVPVATSSVTTPTVTSGATRPANSTATTPTISPVTRPGPVGVPRRKATVPSRPVRGRTRPMASATATTLVPVPKYLGLPDEDLVLKGSGLVADLRALPGGLAAFLLRPFPGQAGGGLSYDLAGLEEVLYYPLYVLAAVGLVAYRHRRDVIAFPLLVMVLVGGVAAEAEGNLGSAFRHRDQLLWAAAVLAVLGSHHLVSLWRRRRAVTSGAPPPNGAGALPELHDGGGREHVRRPAGPVPQIRH